MWVLSPPNNFIVGEELSFGRQIRSAESRFSRTDIRWKKFFSDFLQMFSSVRICLYYLNN